VSQHVISDEDTYYSQEPESQSPATGHYGLYSACYYDKRILNEQ
jgi:hypothetical protein